MRSFPLELLFALFFGVFMLAQFLYGQLRRRALLKQEQNTPPTEARATAVPLATVRITAPANLPKAQRREVLPATAPDAAARASPQIWRRTGRFSRLALMPDQRTIQDAIVIATILAPCHAQRPHEVE